MLELSSKLPNIVVAYSKKNFYIGKNGDLPWKRKLSADLKFLNKLTMKENVAVIMGRKTFESIKQPLKGRVNVVLSSNNYEKLLESTKKYKNLVIFKSYEEAINYCKSNNYIIAILGGGCIYKKAIENDYVIFCTIVDFEEEGDTTFPSHKTELKNISQDVINFVGEGKWKFMGDHFEEENIKYSFHFGKYEHSN